MEKRTIGAILLLIHAIAGLGFMAYVLIMIWTSDFGGFLWLAGGFSICPVLLIIFNIIVLVGAIAAIKGTSYPLALLGGIFAVIQLDLIFGLVGLIMIATAKDEFNGGGAPPQGMYPPPAGYGYPPQQPGQYPPQQGYPPQQPPPGQYPPPEQQAPPPEQPPAAPPETQAEPPKEAEGD